MPVAYFDSSVLMAILLQDEAQSVIAAGLWDQHSKRVSSILLQAECWTGMRRHFARNKANALPAWTKERADFLVEALASVQIWPVDARILEGLQERSELSDCRTLDALHLATALFFLSKSDEGLVVVSLDQRMRQTGQKLKLEVLP
jgi:predicted nucleic acid-binding protein